MDRRNTGRIHRHALCTQYPDRRSYFRKWRPYRCKGRRRIDGRRLSRALLEKLPLLLLAAVGLPESRLPQVLWDIRQNLAGIETLYAER